MISKIQNWFKSRAVYMQTYRELSAMSDRELRDIGIDRGMITDIATEAAYGISTQEPTTSMLSAFIEFFKAAPPITEKDRVNAWLSESSDIVDLERRLKMLDLNQAPWQSSSNRNLQGWV